MIVFEVRNVHEVYPIAHRYLVERCLREDSRNGPVFVSPQPVATVYARPYERVVLWSARDANPFFHLFESLWMLGGRNDVTPLLKYVKRMRDFSDDGKILHDAYGFRWRNWFGIDQLELAISNLSQSMRDRRTVIQMWDAPADLGGKGKALPCNLVATFQFDHAGRLSMVVFCRSNDIVWGAYGANAVHFSFLQEYIAARLFVPVGTYTQVSVNWHAYENTLNQLAVNDAYQPLEQNPYERMSPLRLHGGVLRGSWENQLAEFFEAEREGFPSSVVPKEPFWAVVYTVLKAHAEWKRYDYPDKTAVAKSILSSVNYISNYDWVIAAKEWFERRHRNWEAKNGRTSCQ